MPRASQYQREEAPADYDEANGPWKLEPIKAGWAAFGRSWAVHGATVEEAITRWWEAYERNQVIMARRPPDPPAADEDAPRRARPPGD